jgi:hypothetical protein
MRRWSSGRGDTLAVVDAEARRTTLLLGGRVVQTTPFVGTASRQGLLETPLFVTQHGAVCPVIAAGSAR